MWLGIDSPKRACAFLVAAAIVVMTAIALGAVPLWRAYASIPAENASSSRLHVTRELATTWRSRSPDILILGGSQARELFPEDSFVSAELSAECGRPVGLFNASTSSQPFETSWAVVDHFRGRTPSTIVIAANVFRVRNGGSDPERMARSLLLLPAPTTMPAAADTLQLSWLARWRAHIGISFGDALAAVGLRPQAGPRYTDGFAGALHGYRAPGWDESRKIIEARLQSMLLIELPPSTVSRNIEDYLTLASVIRGSGAQPVFLFPPYSPEANSYLQAAEPFLGQARLSFAGSATVLDLSREETLASADFYDDVHLLSSGRRKLWPQLRPRLLASLQGCPRRIEAN
jgi:hypothetical protein